MTTQQVISASIEDKEFLSQVQSMKITFNSGTQLNVELQTRYKKSNSSKSSSKTSYTILKVNEVRQETTGKQGEISELL